MNLLFISFHTRLLYYVSSILILVCVTASADDTVITESGTLEDNDGKTEVIDSGTPPQAPVPLSQPQAPVPLPQPHNTSGNDNSERKNRNDNQSGMRINFCYFYGDIEKRLYNRISGTYKKFSLITQYYNSYLNLPNYNVLDESKYLFRFQVAAMIKAGRFISIDVGPSLTIFREVNGLEYTDPVDNGLYVDDEYKVTVIGPCITFGVNFVKRFYPIKINVGVLGDVNFNIITCKQKLIYTEDYYGYDEYTERMRSQDFQVNFSFGPRAGIEFFASEHVSFNIDFLYRYYMLYSDINMKIMELPATIDFDNFDYTTVYMGSKWQFILPGLGGGAGINFYF